MRRPTPQKRPTPPRQGRPWGVVLAVLALLALAAFLAFGVPWLLR